MSRLVIDNVSRVFPGVRGGAPTRALEPTDLTIADNDLVTILGPSGCGKSTLLRLIAGLDQPSTGRITLDGKPVTGPGPDRGMVFQSYTLFPWLTIADNIAFGLREKGVPAQRRNEVVRDWLGRDRAHRLRASLSQAALGRHAAAHRDRAGARQRSGDPPARRAVRRARQPDPRADAGAAARHLGARAQDRAVRDPRHRGGDLPRLRACW